MVDPLLVVPSLIHGSQPNARDDVDGSVALEKPLVLIRAGQRTRSIRTTSAVEFGEGVPGQRHARRQMLLQSERCGADCRCLLLEVDVLQLC